MSVLEETLPQGDVGLLRSAVAQRLLASPTLARVAYIAADRSPRVFPMFFHWNGREVILPTFAGAKKSVALQRRPAVAITIDTAGTPPEVLLIRRDATVTDVEGILPEYAQAHRRYAGEEQGADNIAAIDRPGIRMTRIAITPTWVGVLDFTTRFPGGTTAEEFEQRG